MNIIPREGGNTFSGSLFVTGTSEDLQSDNIDQELRDRGLDLHQLGEEQLGGEPGVRRPDRCATALWFFTSGRVLAR